MKAYEWWGVFRTKNDDLYAVHEGEDGALGTCAELAGKQPRDYSVRRVLVIDGDPADMVPAIRDAINALPVARGVKP